MNFQGICVYLLSTQNAAEALCTDAVTLSTETQKNSSVLQFWLGSGC